MLLKMTGGLFSVLYFIVLIKLFNSYIELLFKVLANFQIMKL